MTIFYDHDQKPHEKPENESVVWRISAYGVLENEKGEWLMVEPTWTKNLDFPGGGIKIDEDISAGLAREYYEETGYRVNVDSSPLYIGENNFYYKRKRTFCHVVMMFFRVDLQSEQRDAHVVNTFEDGYEIADMKWVNPDDLKEEEVQLPVQKLLKYLRGKKV